MTARDTVEEIINRAALAHGFNRVGRQNGKVIYQNEQTGATVRLLPPELLNQKTASLSIQAFSRTASIKQPHKPEPSTDPKPAKRPSRFWRLFI